MPKQIHFISGLPRSGSTLFAALLKQNPNFEAGMSGPTGGFFNALLGQMTAAAEFTVFISPEQRRRLLTGVFDNYYEDHAGKVVFDTNRLWCSKMPALAELFPQSKVIACVRHCGWIVDSVERLARRNPFQMSKMFNCDVGGTVFNRAETISRGDGMVGFALNALKEAYFGDHADRLLLLRYETLTGRPHDALKAVYDFIGEPMFEHDFDNVQYDADEFDMRLGTPGLHRVRSKVEFQQRQTVLPPEIFNRYHGDSFWDNAERNVRGVKIV